MTNISFVLNWILFLALFPISFLFLKRAWAIMIKKDFSTVALKHGNPPENPAKYAPFAAIVSLIAGIILVAVIILVIFIALNYDTWTAIAGTTIWIKFFSDFILSRQAHMKIKKRGK